MSWILLLPSFKKAQYSKKSENSKVSLQYYGSEQKKPWFMLVSTPKQFNEPLSNHFPPLKTLEQTFGSMFFKRRGIILFVYACVHA